MSSKLRIDLVIGLLLVSFLSWKLGWHFCLLYTITIVVDIIRWLPGWLRIPVMVGVPAILVMLLWDKIFSVFDWLDEKVSSVAGPKPGGPDTRGLADLPKARVAVMDSGPRYGLDVVETPAPKCATEVKVDMLRDACGDRLVALLEAEGIDLDDEFGVEIVADADNYLDIPGVLGSVVVKGPDGGSELDGTHRGVLYVIAHGLGELWRRKDVYPCTMLKYAKSGLMVEGGRPNRFWYSSVPGLAPWRREGF